MNFTNSSLPLFYRWAQKRHPNVLFYGNPSRREIALTFDDGPHPRDTLSVLGVLDKHGARATFHLVGKHAERHPELIQQIHQRGHQLALHCYRHIPFPLENQSTLRVQLENTRQLIANTCGISSTTIRDLRPPYGAFNEKTLHHLTEWGYRLVMWSCMPPHWMQPVAWSVRQVMEAIMPGSVIVLHDGHGHGRKVAEILEAVIPQIRARGFEFVTVEEMQIKRKPLPAESEARHYNPSKAADEIRIGVWMELISVNIGQEKTLRRRDRAEQTGIFKFATEAPVRVTRLGLEGDVIVSKKHHGGPDQAVYVYGWADYEWWAKELGREIAPGTFGENLTISDLESAGFSIGDILNIGEITLQVTAPRIPCGTFAARMDDSQWVKRFRHAERPGLYCRVLCEGVIRKGDAVTVEKYTGATISVLEMFREYYNTSKSKETIRRHLEAPIAIRARRDLEKELEK